MAREKVYKVIIDGEEYVSQAAQEAGDGMDKFTGKKDGWIKSFVDIRAAWDTIVQVGRALMGVATDSLAAFDEYSASMRKLEGTAKVTGTPLETLTELAAHAKREFGLSSVQANDYATAVNNLATKAGFAGDKQELLAAMLDLGAAKGLTAAESLVAFEQSILGIDEGTDKLFGKNPSGLWADFADQIGKTPGKMSDLDKSMVLIYATMEAGGKVQGSFSEWLDSSAGQTALLSNRINDAQVAFGDLLSPVRAVVVEGLNAFLDSLDLGSGAMEQMKGAMVGLARNGVGVLLGWWQTFGPAVTAILRATVAGVMLFGDAMRALSVATQKAVGEIVDKIGWLVEKGGDILKVFGIDMVSDWGVTMREWGKKTSDQADASWDKFRRESEAAWASVTRDAEVGAATASAPIRQLGNTAQEEIGTKMVAATTTARAAIRDNLGPSLRDLLGVTEQSMKDLAKTATMTLQPAKAADFNAEMQRLVASSSEVRARLNGWNPALENAEETGGDLAREVETLARAGIEAAQAFGVMDSEAAAVLNSVVSLAQTLPKALGGDPTAIAASVLSLANLLGSVFAGDKERQRLLRNNTDALAKLSRDVGGLKLNITGDDFVKAQQALSGVVGQLRGGRGAANENDVRTALNSVGLTMTDLERIGKEFGIELRNNNGALNVDSVRAILDALNMTDLGRLGQGFGDRLDFFRDTQRVTGTQGTAGGLQGFIDYLRQVGGVSALDGFNITSPGARQRFVDLLVGLDNGRGVAPGALGQLTGEQFKDIILEIIDGIDALSDAPATSPSGAPAGTDPLGAPVGESPGEVSPAETLLEVFRRYGERTVPLFEEQIALQTRIADATEATALNTRLTADEVAALNAYFVSGAFAAGVTGIVNRELAQARIREALAQGAGAAI